MTIKLNELQLAKLYKNLPLIRTADPDVQERIKPVIAIVAPPVSHLLAQIGPDQYVRPETMLIAYGASPMAPNIVTGLLQRDDRSFVVGGFDLEELNDEKGQGDGISAEVIDLIGRQPSVMAAGILFMLDEQNLEMERIRPLRDAAESLRNVELALVFKAPNDHQRVPRAWVKPIQMDAQRMREVRPQVTVRPNRKQRRCFWHR